MINTALIFSLIFTFDSMEGRKPFEISMNQSQNYDQEDKYNREAWRPITGNWEQNKTHKGKARGIDVLHLSPDKTSRTSPRRKAFFC